MNQDVFEGKWKELQGQVKEWWVELTNDDREQAVLYVLFASIAYWIFPLYQDKHGRIILLRCQLKCVRFLLSPSW